MKSTAIWKLVVFANLLIGCLLTSAMWAESGGEDAPRLFELRTYTTHDGKLSALHDRFRDHTNELFVKHGMELIAYWTPTDGAEAENTLIYVLAYPNQEARAAAWRDFAADPVWKKAFAESRADGPLVSHVESTMLAPTDYSPLR